MVHWEDQYLTKSEARKRVVQGKNVYTDHLIIISWWKGNNVSTCKSNLVWTQWHYRHLVILLEKISVSAPSRSLQDLHCSLWFAERVFLYWMSIGTSIHSGQQHQCRGKWVFYLSEATLKYIEDFISPFWWGGVLFCNSFITVSETGCTCQKNRGMQNLNSAVCFLAEALPFLVSVQHKQMAHTSKVSTILLCMRMSEFVLIVLWLAWQLSLCSDW